jgi:hypothetical protein
MIEFVTGDCLDYMAGEPEGRFQLVFGSPPYENRRSYGIGFNLSGQAWADWMVKVVVASLRVCNGLVAFVVEGKTSKYRWSATPALLMADLHRLGVHLRKPPIYSRAGIPGSGGPDWLKNDYELIVCATHGGKLPWSDPTACGSPCKYGPGGVPSHRLTDGTRANMRRVRDLASTGMSQRKAAAVVGLPVKASTSGTNDGGTVTQPTYIPPEIANPGNIIHCSVGGGKMGHHMAHENEAPFPEKLAEFFVRSFCPPGGLVLDPFSGSGTTMAACEKFGRSGIGVDMRASQTELGRRRTAGLQRELSI